MSNSSSSDWSTSDGKGNSGGESIERLGLSDELS